jgi:hypothetical protein
MIAASQKYESWTIRPKLRKQPGKIKIGCDDHPFLANAGRKDEVIRRAAHRQIARMDGVVAQRSQPRRQFRRQWHIHQEFHPQEFT